MSQRAICALAQFKEVNLFLRGLIPLVGFKSDAVYYARKPRMAGISKYPFRKMLSFAFDGITSISIKPMTIIMNIGIVCIAASLGMLCYFVLRYFTGNTVPGWASLAVSIWFLGGIQVFALGTIGYYVGKTYLETKGRPRYIIEECIRHETHI